jgi:hypothetical protein
MFFLFGGVFTFRDILSIADSDCCRRNWLRKAYRRFAPKADQRLVRHGHLPEREIMTGIGPVAVCCPRVRDRVGEGRPRAHSLFVGDFASLRAGRKSRSVDHDPLPQGHSTGDFEQALLALLGKDAGGLSASTIGRLKEVWLEEHARWSKRDLSAKQRSLVAVALENRVEPIL